MIKKENILYLLMVCNCSVSLASEKILDEDKLLTPRYITFSEARKGKEQKLEELLASYRTTEKERRSVLQHLEEFSKLSDDVSLFLVELQKNVEHTDIDFAEKGFNKILSDVARIEPHPSGYIPRSEGLYSVSGFFTGELNPKQTLGFISGAAKNPFVTQEGKEWFFSVTLGEQIFKGKVSMDQPRLDSLTLTNDIFISNSISFKLDPKFSLEVPLDKMTKAWNKLFRKSNNGVTSARFFSASIEVPEGLKIEQIPCPPCSVKYCKAENWLPKMPGTDPERGYFILEDWRSGKKYKKIIRHDMISKVDQEGCDFYMPNGRVKIQITNQFNFNQNWTGALVIQNSLVPRNSWTTPYTFSLFQDKKERKYVLRNSDFLEELSRLAEEFLSQKWTQENVFERIKKIFSYQNNTLGEKMSLLENYSALLKRTLKNEEAKLIAYKSSLPDEEEDNT